MCLEIFRRPLSAKKNAPSPRVASSGGSGAAPSRRRRPTPSHPHPLRRRRRGRRRSRACPRDGGGGAPLCRRSPASGDPSDGAARSGVVALFAGVGGWIRGFSGRIRRVVVRCWWCGADGGGVERARSCWSGVSGRLVMTLWWALAGGGEARRSWLVMACRCEARRPVAAWCSSPRRRSCQARSALPGGEGSWPAHGR